MPGLLGKKIGMTSVFSADGKNVPCTVIEAGPCVIFITAPMTLKKRKQQKNRKRQRQQTLNKQFEIIDAEKNPEMVKEFGIMAGKNVIYSLQDEHIRWILEETYAHISER